MKRLLLALLALSLLFAGCSKEEPVLEGPFQVPAGFVVEPVGGSDKLGSLIQLTFDAQGRPLVSKERSHPTLLLDNDGDGEWDAEQVFSDQVENCQGVFFDGPTLYAVCTNPDDGEACLFRLPDENGDGGVGYTKEIRQGNQAMLEFETSIDGKYVNGVDIITCDDDGMITEFKVMIRPLQAINLVHEQMKAMLERMGG